MELFCFTPKNEKTRKALFCKALRVFVKKHWSERHDLNVNFKAATHKTIRFVHVGQTVCPTQCN